MIHSKIVWKLDLKTGIGVIDKQHKEFFSLVNRMLKNSISYEDKHLVYESFDFLHVYISEHFGTEESFMIEFKYPDYAGHKTRHVFFRKELAELDKLLRSTEYPVHDVGIKLNYLIVNWFTNHIKTEDKKLSKFLIENAEDRETLFTRLSELAARFFKPKRKP